MVGGGDGRDPADEVVGYLVVPPHVTAEMNRRPPSVRIPTARSQTSFIPISFLSGWTSKRRIFNVLSAVFTAWSASWCAPKRRKTHKFRSPESTVDDALACRMSWMILALNS